VRDDTPTLINNEQKKREPFTYHSTAVKLAVPVTFFFHNGCTQVAVAVFFYQRRPLPFFWLNGYAKGLYKPEIPPFATTPMATSLNGKPSSPNAVEGKGQKRKADEDGAQHPFDEAREKLDKSCIHYYQMCLKHRGDLSELAAQLAEVKKKEEEGLAKDVAYDLKLSIFLIKTLIETHNGGGGLSEILSKFASFGVRIEESSLDVPDSLCKICLPPNSSSAIEEKNEWSGNEALKRCVSLIDEINVKAGKVRRTQEQKRVVTLVSALAHEIVENEERFADCRGALGFWSHRAFAHEESKKSILKANKGLHPQHLMKRYRVDFENGISSAWTPADDAKLDTDF